MTGISLKNISKKYGSFAAASDISLDVQDGEFLTILGPSGSGKTTLLSLIAGLSKPSSGQILIGGTDVTDLSPQARNIGLVFQSYALFPHMSVAQNVAFPLAVRKWDRVKTDAAVKAALDLMQLSTLVDRKPTQLSGGQQQRVALARAIVFEPSILLLDEPLGALDKKLREELQVELKQLQRRLGITTLLVTHDQEEALSMADRVMILNEGVVQQIATPETAYQQPENRFVAEFLGTANFVMMTGGKSGVIRPERIDLTDELNTGSIRGKIREMVYLGQMVRYYIECANGEHFVCTRPFNGQKFGLNSTVSMSWAERDVWPIG